MGRSKHHKALANPNEPLSHGAISEAVNLANRSCLLLHLKFDFAVARTMAFRISGTSRARTKASKLASDQTSSYLFRLLQKLVEEDDMYPGTRATLLDAPNLSPS